MALIPNTPAPIFRFNERAGRFITSKGRFVSEEAVLSALDGYIENKMRTVTDSLFEQLRTGQISLAEMQTTVEREMAKTAIASSTLAKGGRAQLSQADYGRIGGLLRPRLVAWRDYMAELAAGGVIDGRVKNAIRSALLGSRGIYHAVESVEADKRGMDEYKRILNDGARHCPAQDGRPSCPGEAAKGWQKRGTGASWGGCGCYNYCKCGFQYRNSVTGEVWK